MSKKKKKQNNLNQKTINPQPAPPNTLLLKVFFVAIIGTVFFSLNNFIDLKKINLQEHSNATENAKRYLSKNLIDQYTVYCENAKSQINNLVFCSGKDISGRYILECDSLEKSLCAEVASEKI